VGSLDVPGKPGRILLAVESVGAFYTHLGQQSGRTGAPDEGDAGKLLNLWLDMLVDRLT